MDGYNTDQEQVEAIKKWWEENGKLIVVGVLIVLTGTIGWRVWDNYQTSTVESASLEFSRVMESLQQGNADAALKQGAELIEKRSKTPYAPLAALAMAKLEVESGESSAAQARLGWVLDNSVMPEIAHIARLRLARVLISESKLDEALTHATTPDVGEFAAAYELIKGDIYAQRGLEEQARTAYNLALVDDDVLSGATKHLLQVKLDNLGRGDERAHERTELSAPTKLEVPVTPETPVALDSLVKPDGSEKLETSEELDVSKTSDVVPAPLEIPAPLEMPEKLDVPVKLDVPAALDLAPEVSNVSEVIEATKTEPVLDAAESTAASESPATAESSDASVVPNTIEPIEPINVPIPTSGDVETLKIDTP